MKRSESSGTIQGSTADGSALRDGRPLRRWERPVVVDLPRLTQLTLQTSSPGACDCPGAGGVVIP